MNFYEYWKLLDEFYKIDNFKDFGSQEVYYHFYEDLTDLINSLTTGTIYSTKNDRQENIGQYDTSAKEYSSYVCMTSTITGKNYMANKFRRPFGLSFTEDTLNKICKKPGYSLRPYSAFSEKGSYEMRKGKPVLLAKTKEFGNNPFSIFAIGELKDGVYFVSGGQGSARLWPAQVFNDTKLYQELKDWFLNNMNADTKYQQQIYYWFTDKEGVGNIEQWYLNKPIKVSGNLNKNYQPRSNTEDPNKYDASIAFEFKGQYAHTFKEVIGYGPINLIDDKDQLLLYLNYVNPSVKGGYKGPLLHGKNLSALNSENEFEIENNYRTISKTMSKRGESNQRHLFTSKETFEKLCQVFTENEYRIYLDNGRDFSFKPNDIYSIVIPETFTISSSGETINLKLLIEKLLESNYNNLPDLESQLLADNIISKKSKETKCSKYVLAIVKQLINLLQTSYNRNNLAIEFIKDKNTKSHATFTSYLKDGGEDIIKSDADIKAKDKHRKLINSWPDLSKCESKSGQNGETTTVAPIEVYPGLPKEDWPLARIGSEVILTAIDKNEKPYVLFVYKAKSSTFMELPGGGFRGNLVSQSDFEPLLYDRLKFKCNINNSEILSLNDTGKGIILHEAGVAKDKAVLKGWLWSYYRLYTATYGKILNIDNLDYSYNNKEVAKELEQKLGQHINGYNAYLRWVPVNNIILNRSITDRYSNIIPIIEAQAKKTVEIMKAEAQQVREIISDAETKDE